MINDDRDCANKDNFIKILEEPLRECKEAKYLRTLISG